MGRFIIIVVITIITIITTIATITIIITIKFTIIFTIIFTNDIRCTGSPNASILQIPSLRARVSPKGGGVLKSVRSEPMEFGAELVSRDPARSLFCLLPARGDPSLHNLAVGFPPKQRQYVCVFHVFMFYIPVTSVVNVVYQTNDDHPFMNILARRGCETGIRRRAKLAVRRARLPCGARGPGVGKKHYLLPPNASVQWQPDGLTIHTNNWFLGAGFLGAPPISLTQTPRQMLRVRVASLHRATVATTPSASTNKTN